MVVLLPYVLKAKKCLVLTPSKIISDQLAAQFGHLNVMKSFFNTCGIEQEHRQLKKLMEPVLLCNTQKEVDTMETGKLVIVNAQKFGGRSRASLSHNDSEVVMTLTDKLKEFDLIIVDEAHHWPAKTWVNIVNIFEGTKVVFLTATPFRGQIQNEMSMLKFEEIELIFEISRESLQGSTIRPRRFIEGTYDGDGEAQHIAVTLKRDIGDYLEENIVLEDRLTKPQAMVLVNGKDFAIKLAHALGANDAVAIVSDRNMSTNLELFTKGERKIAVVCGMLREGYDNPNVVLCAVLRRCQSRVLFEQFTGRCIRMNRDLTGVLADKTIGTVLSYPLYKQKAMWDVVELMALADRDPEEEEGILIAEEN